MSNDKTLSNSAHISNNKSETDKVFKGTAQPKEKLINSAIAAEEAIYITEANKQVDASTASQTVSGEKKRQVPIPAPNITSPRYKANIKTIYGIWFKNLFLEMVTFMIYRPWAKTNMR